MNLPSHKYCFCCLYLTHTSKYFRKLLYVIYANWKRRRLQYFYGNVSWKIMQSLFLYKLFLTYVGNTFNWEHILPYFANISLSPLFHWLLKNYAKKKHHETYEKKIWKLLNPEIIQYLLFMVIYNCLKVRMQKPFSSLP